MCFLPTPARSLLSVLRAFRVSPPAAPGTLLVPGDWPSNSPIAWESPVGAQTALTAAFCSRGMCGRSVALAAGVSRVCLFLVLRCGGALWSLSNLASFLSEQQKKEGKKIFALQVVFFTPYLPPSAHIN